MSETVIIIIAAAAALVVIFITWLITHTAVSSRWKDRLSIETVRWQGLLRSKDEDLAEKDMLIARKEAELEGEKKLAQERQAAHQEFKQVQEKALQQQIAAIKAEMTARTEEILKAREDELDKKAKETFQSISSDLGKDLKDMKDAFEASKKTQSETSASLKERFESAVKDLEAQTRTIGDKADHLADAMRGRKKLQGCWGETILLNLLTDEGLVEGRDFHKEATLRDELGFVIRNEDSERKMRPDFILHFPDSNDIVIDSKVSLSAYADYIEAGGEQERKDAAKRNTEAIKEQVKNLSRKDYSRYLVPGHRMLDFVIMFVPNYPALQLAYAEDPGIWKAAYADKVLITTEETLMPFLRMISIAWTNVEQVRNQQQIITKAQDMIDRVADFAKFHAEMGKKLDEARACYEKCDDKLKDSGRSIVTSARQVVQLGVPANPKKPLPAVNQTAELEESVD